MKIKERLLECKIKKGIKSNYGLAKELGCPRQHINDVMNGTVKPDAYLAVKIGEILGVHPLMLLAEFEGEKAKTPERAAFWENFGRRIKTGALGIVALISTAFWSPEPRDGELTENAHNVYFIPITGGMMRVIILQL